MRVNVDIETALYNKLTKDKYSASAHMLPASLGDTLPHIHVVRTGGYEENMVIEYNNVDFDVYAVDAADAMTEASNLCSWVRELAGDTLDTQCYISEITTLPYSNPDPRHPSISRATFKALISTRMRGKKNA